MCIAVLLFPRRPWKTGNLAFLTNFSLPFRPSRHSNQAGHLKRKYWMKHRSRPIFDSISRALWTSLWKFMTNLKNCNFSKNWLAACLSVQKRRASRTNKRFTRDSGRLRLSPHLGRGAKMQLIPPQHAILHRECEITEVRWTGAGRSTTLLSAISMHCSHGISH